MIEIGTNLKEVLDSLLVGVVVISFLWFLTKMYGNK